jgi:hypothetical protein
MSRRTMIAVMLGLVAGAGRALAKVCSLFQGSGNGQSPCAQCKGTGIYRGFQCPECKGRKFKRCSQCGGSGQTKLA